MPRVSGIFTDAEYRLLMETYPLDTVSKYHCRRVIPHTPRRLKIIATLKRDPWNGAEGGKAGRPKAGRPKGSTRDADAANAKPPVLPPAAGSVKVATPDTIINACCDDDLCVAARTASMRYVPNTLEDQRRRISCTDCPRGIERARTAAARKKINPGYLCGCGEPKVLTSRMCKACAAELKRRMK